MGNHEAINQRLALLEGALDITPGSYLHCSGNPSDCGEACTAEACPLQNNRMQELGSIVLTLLEELRWHRALSQELEHQGLISKGTQERVALRVQKSQLQDTLDTAEATLQEVGTVFMLRKQVEHRVLEIRAEIQAVTERLEETS